ncbi:hypothetical protein HDU77_010468 [Chytriomyces hyalinus]|nr:hypothetical protein HDU77_010468 [Chytriomyces hyalinus]
MRAEISSDIVLDRPKKVARLQRLGMTTGDCCLLNAGSKFCTFSKLAQPKPSAMTRADEETETGPDTGTEAAAMAGKHSVGLVGRGSTPAADSAAQSNDPPPAIQSEAVVHAGLHSLAHSETQPSNSPAKQLSNQPVKDQTPLGPSSNSLESLLTAAIASNHLQNSSSEILAGSPLVESDGPTPVSVLPNPILSTLKSSHELSSPTVASPNLPSALTQASNPSSNPASALESLLAPSQALASAPLPPNQKPIMPKPSLPDLIVSLSQVPVHPSSVLTPLTELHVLSPGATFPSPTAQITTAPSTAPQSASALESLLAPSVAANEALASARIDGSAPPPPTKNVSVKPSLSSLVAVALSQVTGPSTATTSAEYLQVTGASALESLLAPSLTATDASASGKSKALSTAVPAIHSATLSDIAVTKSHVSVAAGSATVSPLHDGSISRETTVSAAISASSSTISATTPITLPNSSAAASVSTAPAIRPPSVRLQPSLSRLTVQHQLQQQNQSAQSPALESPRLVKELPQVPPTYSDLSSAPSMLSSGIGSSNASVPGPVDEAALSTPSSNSFTIHSVSDSVEPVFLPEAKSLMQPQVMQHHVAKGVSESTHSPQQSPPQLPPQPPSTPQPQPQPAVVPPLSANIPVTATTATVTFPEYQSGIVPAGSLGVSSLKPDFELPVRGVRTLFKLYLEAKSENSQFQIHDFLYPKDPLHASLTSQISSWPVTKSGFLFRRDLNTVLRSNSHAAAAGNASNYSSLFPSVRPTTSTLSNLSTNSANSANGGGSGSGKFGRGFMNMLAGGSASGAGGGNSSGRRGTVGSVGVDLSQQGVYMDARSPSIASTLSYNGLSGGGTLVEDEEDWALYYVEVRGRYMVFYLVLLGIAGPSGNSINGSSGGQPETVLEKEEDELEAKNGKRSSGIFGQQQPQQQQPQQNQQHGSSGRRGSQFSFSTVKEKPQMGLNKIFSEFTNISRRTKAAAQILYNQNLKRPSSSADFRLRVTNHSPIPPATSLSGGSSGPGVGGFGGNGDRAMSGGGVDHRRLSTDSGRSLWSTLSPNDIKNAPRMLIHYIPLHMSSFEYVFTRGSVATPNLSTHSQMFSTFTDLPSPPPATNLPTHLSLCVRVGIPSPLDTNPSGKEERLMLDIVDELTWDWNPNTPTGAVATSTDTISSGHSIGLFGSPKPSATVKKAELDEWVSAVKAVSLLSFDPMVSTYGVWEQQQLQAMSRVATSGSGVGVSNRASSASIGSLAGGSGNGISGGGAGFIQRSLTRLSFGMGASEKRANTGSPTLVAGTLQSPAEVASVGWWHTSGGGMGANAAAGGASSSNTSLRLGRRGSFSAQEFPGIMNPDMSIYSTSPSAHAGGEMLQHKGSFPKIFTRGSGAVSAGVSGGSKADISEAESLKTELKIGLSSPKRLISDEQAGLAAANGQNARLRGPHAFKPWEPSPLSPPLAPGMIKTASGFSWRDRGKSDPPIYDPKSTFSTDDVAAGEQPAMPLPNGEDLQIGRKRAMSHGVAVPADFGAPVSSSADGRKFFHLFNKKDKEGSDGAAGSHGASVALPAAGKPPLDENVYVAPSKPVPTRPSLLPFGFGSKSGMKRAEKNTGMNLGIKRNATIRSNASSLRKVVAKGNKDVKRESVGTFASANGTYRSGLEWTGDVPLIVRKCVRLIEEIGLETEGIYRISGSMLTIQKLERLFESDPTRVHLHAPSYSRNLASLNIPFIADSPRRRAGSRLSLTDTISSSRSSLDAEALSALAATGPMSKIIEMGGSSRVGVVRSGPAASSGTALLLGSGSPSLEQSRGRKPRKAGELPNSADLGSGAIYDNDVHVVTGVLKSYLRKGMAPRKEPVTTFEQYEAFIAAAVITDWTERMTAIQDIVHQLPTENFETLRFICQHLKRVASFESANKMTVKNLSIIFGPTMLRPPPHLDSLQRSMSDMPNQVSIMDTLIDYADWVFGPIEFESQDPEMEIDESVGARSQLSPRASMISEDESFAPLNFNKRSSRNPFWHRQRLSDGEKDSIADVLDLIPLEDSSSRIPDDSIRGSIDGSQHGGMDFGEYGIDDSDYPDDDDYFNETLGDGIAAASFVLPPMSTAKASSLKPSLEDISVKDDAASISAASAAEGVNTVAGMSRQIDDKKARRRGHIVSAVLLDSVNKIVISNQTGLMNELRDLVDDQTTGGPSSQGSIPVSPSSSVCGTGSVKSSVSRRKKLSTASSSFSNAAAASASQQQAAGDSVHHVI